MEYVKMLWIPEKYNGSFNFYSSGYNKNYNTNINETTLNNDFLFESNQLVNNFGLSNRYNLLLKNTNSYTNNTSDHSYNENYDLFGTIKFDTTLPSSGAIRVPYVLNILATFSFTLC